MKNKKMIWYLETERKIDEWQFCFRNQRSPIDTISKITTKDLKKIQKIRENDCPFFNIEKSCDMINCQKIL